MTYFPEYGQAVHFKSGKRTYYINNKSMVNNKVIYEIIARRVKYAKSKLFVESERLVFCK
jgi:hypothetical protein